MSVGRKPKGSPVRPPIPNMGKNASAKSMGTLNRMDPPQRLKTRQLRIATDGIEITMVVVMKNMLKDVFIPLRNMWCAHTKKENSPTKFMAATMVLYPVMGLRVLLAMISETMP